MRQHVAFPTAPIALTLILAGCAMRDSDWSPSDRVDKGPIAGGSNARAAVLHRCIEGNFVEKAYFSNGGMRCLTAFKLPSGRLLAMDALERAIDDHLRALPDFATWPRDGYHARAAYDPPYKFHLLSLEPTLLLATPFPANRHRGNCFGPMNRHLCVSSALVREGFPYDALPEVTGDAFWFAPGLTIGMASVPTSSEPYRIPLDGIEAYLEKVGGRWTFRRVR